MKKLGSNGKKRLEFPFFRHTDISEMRLKPGEAVCDINVKLTLGKHPGDRRTFDRGSRDVKFWLFNTPESGTRTLLAAVLLHVWQTTNEGTSTKESIVEFLDVMAENGFITIEDLNSHFKQPSPNKGGRPRRPTRETLEIKDWFEQLTRESPIDSAHSERDVVKQIARKFTSSKNPTHIGKKEVKVRKALVRLGLLASPPTRKKPAE